MRWYLQRLAESIFSNSEFPIGLCGILKFKANNPAKCDLWRNNSPSIICQIIINLNVQIDHFKSRSSVNCRTIENLAGFKQSFVDGPRQLELQYCGAQVNQKMSHHDIMTRKLESSWKYAPRDLFSKLFRSLCELSYSMTLILVEV